MHRSVFYRGTGRFVHSQAEARDYQAKNPDAVIRNNEIHEPEFLQDTRGKSLFKDGQIASGELDCRLNATGDTADVATGYQIVTDTLTYISRQISRQKFFEVAPADYLPIMVGEGAFANDLLFNRTYSTAEDFEAGIVDQANSDSRLSTADAAIDGVSQKTCFWAKAVQYSTIEINQALFANGWDPIQGKMQARKQNWDLGLQILAFLGLVSDGTNFPGLLTNANVNTNTAIITKYISAMSAAELATFLAAFIPAYITNVGSTAMPDTLLMPQIDYIACSQLMVPGTVGTYPVNLLDYLQQSFARATRNAGFKIIPLYYADKTVNNALRSLNKNYYALYRRDAESLRMNIPIDLTVLQANTINNFQFHSVAYGQFTGVAVLRNLELLLFTF